MESYTFLLVVYFATCILDLVLAVRSFRHEGYNGRYLGFACVGTFVVTVSYLCGLFTTNSFVFSLLSSVHFIGIDFILVCSMYFTWHFTRDGEGKKTSWLLFLLASYTIFDGIVLLINPFHEISVGFVPREAVLGHFAYNMHTLYIMHLVYAYLMIFICLYCFVSKMVHAPLIYARRYTFCVIGIVVGTVMNVIYRFFPSLSGDDALDYTLLSCNLIGCFFYWNCFQYSSHGLLSHFHTWIFKNIDQGIVLFDYDDKLILYNKKAEEQLPDGILVEGLTLEAFLKGCGINRRHSSYGHRYVFQCFVNNKMLRCDYSVQVNKNQNRLGRLFVFSSMTTVYDVITGFHSWTNFKENADQMFPESDKDLVVATVDINSLRNINLHYGRVTGDRVIQRLAEELRSEFPMGTEFTRSREASMAAICRDMDRAEVEEHIRNIQERLQNNDLIEGPIRIQSAISLRDHESVTDTIRRNLQSIQTKKLMDKTSIRSELLRSLLQALTQCDPDTGAHVERTQKAGEELGRRIGLSDEQQSNLALLAILHDIGKIGIPLEILNKPGKLTDAEWKMLQTHTEKGYQIAKSSRELSGIADMILDHHERWDGKGYPSGLRETQIPLLSRIIAVVDSYDAMTNDRCYRKALPASAARAELQRCAGTQFDPNIVREYLNMLEENDREMGIIIPVISQQEPKGNAEYSTERMAWPLEQRNVHALSYSIYVLDNKYRIASVDDRFESITGYSKQDVADLELTQRGLIFPEDLVEYLTLIGEMRTKSTDCYVRHRLRRKNGEAIFVNCYGHAFYDSAVGEERTRVVIMNSDDPFET